ERQPTGPQPETPAPGGDSTPPTPTPAAGSEAAAWRLSKPIAAPTDDLTLTSLLTALTGLQTERRLEAVPPDRLREFGLDKPIFVLEFTAAGASHRLRFGQKVPGSQLIYAQADDDPRILLLRQSDKETLDRNLTALRAKNIFTLKPGEVTEVRLVRGQDKLILQKTGTGSWRPAAPLQVKLREDRLQTLLRQLANARAVEFVAEKAEDLKKYGLAPSPTLRLTLRREGQEETLIIGGQQGERYYAQVAGKPPIFLVDKYLLEKLPTSCDVLEDRRLWPGPENEVQKITWGPPAEQTVATREKDGWTILTKEQQTLRQTAMKVNLALWRLKDLEYGRMLTNVVDVEKTRPLFTIQLLGAENNLLFRLAELQAEKDQVQVIFTVGEQTQAATVSAQTLTEVKELLQRLATPDKAGADKPDGT
ncbi:MAG: DUF4340 domain-containing protein, partial [Desulfobacca sp.]|uniref:DUF4340 domain-containing protein n=1 Tax=Desulfobacca sp. TaxID=2067990 RepID=UPI00404A3406